MQVGVSYLLRVQGVWSSFGLSLRHTPPRRYLRKRPRPLRLSSSPNGQPPHDR